MCAGGVEVVVCSLCVLGGSRWLCVVCVRWASRWLCVLDSLFVCVVRTSPWS